MSQNNASPRDHTSDWEAFFFEDDPSELEAAAEEDDPSDPEDFTEQGLNAKKVALCISRSVVSLVSSVDGNILFACTGTVVDHVGSATWILTSATLVRKPGTDYDAYQGGEVKIEVLLHNKRAIDGCIAMCNLQYNIAVVTVESQLDLPMVALNDLPGCYSTLVRPVIAVGRDSKSQGLLVRHGDMIRERSKLDCSELLVCTCPVSKMFIGGLVMDFERRIIGISFFGKDITPVLPIDIAARCLQHFKYFGTLKQPPLCIRGHALHSLELSNLEKICYRCPDLSTGIVVHQIPEVLSANCGGIEVGDIICSIDGVVLHSVAQLTGILLDGMVVAGSSKNRVILQVRYDCRWMLP
ncbi:uncharacterized protein LOC133901165 isoform X2 [Phragmites australis]|uniref:uncharacterized protein LOC133901165 isoform X2 n=1 Tax=Phragmites australis TaxID=29695 RepID=UPI002D78AD44|nr:uncharacterized protein LOC133901165 isoform X2 [Phragmites australis]